MTLKLYMQMASHLSLIHVWQSQLQKVAWVRLANFARSVLKRKVSACWQRNESSNIQVVDSDREPELLKSSAGKASACKTYACGSVQSWVV